MSYDINKICRTCLTNNGPMISIFKGRSVNSNTLYVAEMLNVLTAINFKPDDKMPKRVCLPCISEINRCYTFKIKCENSSNTLLQLLHDHPIETEEIISMPTRKLKRYETSDIEKFKSEIMYSVKELGQHRDELMHEPEELIQETEESVQEPEELVLKSEEFLDPLEEDSHIISSKYCQNIELANAVKKFQCLYNNGNRDYKNKNKRRKAWHKISKALNLPERTCQSRWKCIRDHYVKLIKSATACSAGKRNCRWPLLKHVEFLSDHIKWKTMEYESEYDPALGFDVNISLKPESSIKLVHEVQKFKCLYERNSKEYTSKLLRSKAWHEVSTKMNLPENLCQARWKNIRDRYVRMCRSASESGGTEIDNQWHLLKHVQFLRDHIWPKRSATTAEIPSDCEPIEVDVTEITYDFDDSLDNTSFN